MASCHRDKQSRTTYNLVTDSKKPVAGLSNTTWLVSELLGVKRIAIWQTIKNLVNICYLQITLLSAVDLTECLGKDGIMFPLHVAAPLEQIKMIHGFVLTLGPIVATIRFTSADSIRLHALRKVALWTMTIR